MLKKIRRHFRGGGGARSSKQEENSMDKPATLDRIIDHWLRNGIIIMPLVSAF
jgi:hypothetical protein